MTRPYRRPPTRLREYGQNISLFRALGRAETRPSALASRQLLRLLSIAQNVARPPAHMSAHISAHTSAHVTHVTCGAVAHSFERSYECSHECSCDSQPIWETATLFEDMEYEDTDLTMFTIKSLDLVHRNSSRPEKGIMMRIVLKRKATMELMTTYLPTLLLLLLTFSGTFFRVELFGDAMAHNLTIMLVMTTIFTSKIAELPPTSDMKMLDVWLIFCLFVPFSVALIQTAIEYYRDDTTGDTGTKKRGQPGSTMVRPGSALFETGQEV